jgi:hypothetical protein
MMNVGLMSLELDVARDKIILDLGELTGNIWSLNRPEGASKKKSVLTQSGSVPVP